MYNKFAEIYDEFMDTVDYASWSRFIISRLAGRGIRDGLVLDLACGTGTLTELLASAGYDCIGVDASDEMLREALSKRDASGHDILYLEQDMTGFELYGTVRAVVCACDSINYLLDEDSLLQTFRLVNNYLDPGGLFIFDFNTENVYAAIGSDTIAEARDEGSFIWENDFDSSSGLNEYRLTLFVPANTSYGAVPANDSSGSMAANDSCGSMAANDSCGSMAANASIDHAAGGDYPVKLYTKHEEIHVQKAWSLPVIRDLLAKAGLVFEEAFDGYTDAGADASSERVVVIARESGKLSP